MSEANNEKPYIKENIVKKKPSPLKWLQKLLACIIFAVVFGTVATCTFFLIRPYFEKNEPEETTGITIFPSEDRPTQEVVESPETTETEESTSIDDEQIRFNHEEKEWIKGQVSSGVKSDVLTIEDVDRADELLKGVATAAKKSLITIKGYVGETVVWTTQTIAIYKREDNNQILLLGMRSTIKEADRIVAVLPSSKQEKEALLMGFDGVFDLEVLSLSLDRISEEDIKAINIMEIGKNYSVGACDTLLVIGEPYLNKDSVAIGHVTYYETTTGIDSSFRVFATDMQLPAGAVGYVIDLSGKLIGIVNNSVSSTVPAGYTTVVGTLNLNDTLNCMCNGKTPSMLGIYGQTVTEELMSSNMPKGVYVTDVLPDGPAYNSGICAGDIITAISQAEITDINTMSRVLTSYHLPGETVIVTIYRESIDGYKEKTVTVKLGSR